MTTPLNPPIPVCCHCQAQRLPAEQATYGAYCEDCYALRHSHQLSYAAEPLKVVDKHGEVVLVPPASGKAVLGTRYLKRKYHTKATGRQLK